MLQKSHNKHFAFFSLTLMSILIFPSCNVGKKITEEKKTESVIVTTDKPEVYLKHQLDYKTFFAKADVRLETKEETQRVNVHFNMNKDKDLMASVRALGMVEVAKAFASPDSVFALNRLNKTAYALDYQDGTQLIKAEVPFTSLQGLIVGNSLLSPTAKVTKMEVKDSIVSIVQTENNFEQISEFNIHTRLLSKLNLKATNTPFSCSIVFKKYGKIATGQVFPYYRYIEFLNNKEKTIAEINFNQASINTPVNTNFSIPGSYKVINKID